MSYILVTNDDGVDSPALIPLVRAVEQIGPVRVACPARESSWIGKAITRFQEIRVERVEREGIEILAIGGSPADCTNLSVHSIMPEPPEMVVSGVNIGLNTWLGFFLLSGTVGAAMEAWIAGIPALAFSVGRPGHDREWKRGVASESSREMWRRAAELSADIVRGVRESGFPPDVHLISVNFPVEADVDTARVITRLAEVGYVELFRRKKDGCYTHDYRGEIRSDGPLDGTDVVAVSKGWVSITPVRLAAMPELSADLCRSLRARPL